MLLGLAEGDAPCSGKDEADGEQTHEGTQPARGCLCSRHKEPLRREPVSLSCNEAAHALHTQGALHPYNSLTERLSILLQSFILLAQWISTIWGCGLLKERMKDTDRQISVYFRGLRRHTYTQPVSRCHTALQLQTVSPIKTQSHMEKTS